MPEPSISHLYSQRVRLACFKQAVCVATRYAPARCTPDAAAQLQPIPYACGAQCALLPIAVGAMNINELMNINDVHESATIFPCPCKFTFNLLTLKVVSDSLVTWATCVPILVFLGFSFSRVRPDVLNRQTDVRQHHGLMPPPRGRGIKCPLHLLLYLLS